MLLSIGLQQVGHDLVIEQLYIYIYLVWITSWLGDIKEVT